MENQPQFGMKIILVMKFYNIQLEEHIQCLKLFYFFFLIFLNFTQDIYRYFFFFRCYMVVLLRLLKRKVFKF